MKVVHRAIVVEIKTNKRLGEESGKEGYFYFVLFINSHIATNTTNNSRMDLLDLPLQASSSIMLSKSGDYSRDYAKGIGE